MKAIALSFVVALSACQPGAAAPSPKVHTVAAVNAPFAQYRTFALGFAERPPAPYTVSEESFEVERRAQELIAAELMKKGYALANGNADLVVRFSAGTSKMEAALVKEQTLNEDRSQQVSVGGLVIDAFDASSRVHVWHGTAEARIDSKGIDDQLLQAAVQQVLAKFPVRSNAMAIGVTDRQVR
jgi:hypothetical protein